MRIPAFILFSLVLLGSDRLAAQNPGAQQDAEAAREKLLNAADQLDNIQANSEATKTSLEGMKTQTAQTQAELTQLETANAALKQQVADLQAAFDQYKAEQVKSRQALIDNVAAMIAEKPNAAKTRRKEMEGGASIAPAPVTPPLAKKSEFATSAPNLAPPPDSADDSNTTPSAKDSSTDTVAATKPQKGYYHLVEKGETLKMICTAYRENGVKVTMAQVRKANGLTENGVLKPGQKLFIPQPGT